MQASRIFLLTGECRNHEDGTASGTAIDLDEGGVTVPVTIRESAANIRLGVSGDWRDVQRDVKPGGDGSDGHLYAQIDDIAADLTVDAGGIVGGGRGARKGSAQAGGLAIRSGLCYGWPQKRV